MMLTTNIIGDVVRPDTAGALGGELIAKTKYDGRLPLPFASGAPAAGGLDA